MGKLLLTGVDGNLGGEAARILLELAPHDQLIFCGYSEASLAPYAAMGIETHVTPHKRSVRAFLGEKGGRCVVIHAPTAFLGPKSTH